MKAAGRLVIMYLMLAACLGLVSLYVGCVGARHKAPAVIETPVVQPRTETPAKPPEKLAEAPAAPERALAGETKKESTAPARAKRSAGSLAAPSAAPLSSAAGGYVLPGRYNPNFETNAFDHFEENPFLKSADNPLSTFSIDVDTAAYAIVRTMLNQGRRPPKGAVRIEELVNYFSYDYPAPKNGAPFSVNLMAAECPWAEGHKLVRIGLKGREVKPAKRPPSNLVFLIDVSGSMTPPNKLPLVKRSMTMLLDQLNEKDCVAIVVYAGAAGLALPSTRCHADGKATIKKVIESLGPGGSTQGSAGIKKAYEEAADNFIKGGTNRVILCTDGDFNVGTTDQGELVDMIEAKAKTGVFLSVLGFGMGNLKDSTMEKLADKGNGNYGYVDTINEARKLLVEGLSGTLLTIAKDVKIQVEFNPAEVAAYRLLGYENRMLAKEDFNDDKKDAGEIGAGHTVTALYEIVPAGQEVPQTGGVDPLKYQKPAAPSKDAGKGELLTVKLRYKEPAGDTSKLIATVLKGGGKRFEQAPEDFRFAAAVAAFGMILRDSPNKGAATLDEVIKAALAAKGADENSTRAEFVSLARLAKELK